MLSLKVSNKLIKPRSSVKCKVFNIPFYQAPPTKWSYKEFTDAIDKDFIEFILVKTETLEVTDTDGDHHIVQTGRLTQPTMEKIIEHDVIINRDMFNFQDIFNYSIYFLIFSTSILFIMQFFGKGRGNPFLQSKATLIKPGDQKKFPTTFADVAGIDEAKAELQEIVDFLKAPLKYTKLGAKIPKGCLLASLPGTGKTLLARAVANEANVPFIYCSASEFIELYVGLGASRIRQIFKQAKENSPCILFIDEIDAVGKTRSSGGVPGNEERDQTINQLLVEMDGFEINTGVIIMGATNRVDVLDKALLRPGRFDRIIEILPPDVKGRKAILEVHTRNKPLAQDVDLTSLSKVTAGFSGAELENLANEAAIAAAREDRTEITRNDFDTALDRIQIGLKRGNIMSAQQKEIVAVHEAGHTITALNLSSEFDTVKKVSILGRGAAGGVTVFEPQDVALYGANYLKNQLVVALGGRAAEEIVYGKGNVTTGASSDLKKVQEIAKAMVTEFGFSDAVGQMSVSDSSEQLAYIIEQEMQKLVKEAYQRAINIIENNAKQMRQLVNALLEKETLDRDEIIKILG